ncbi:MAG: ribose 5-phosphate isomerase B [Candidatus Omnitrophica bacterium]|nr:ribose 5-phosphate isomerase B [Candidatus Omnitrophota bacterium]
MTKDKNIILGSDHAGFALKEKVKVFLLGKGYEVFDVGTFSEDSCDYPVYAAKLAGVISSGKFKRGILACKTGIGDSIVANRFCGVRAALCYNTTAARLCRQHNDSNVLVLGSLFVKGANIKKIISIWLNTEFVGGRHARRLNLIKKLEKKAGCRKQ